MLSLLGDEIYIEGKDGSRVGPIKAFVQNKEICVKDTSLNIEAGGRILRALPNGKSEVHNIVECKLIKDPKGGSLSYYLIHTQKIGSLVQTPGGSAS